MGRGVILERMEGNMKDTFSMIRSMAMKFTFGPIVAFYFRFLNNNWWDLER